MLTLLIDKFLNTTHLAVARFCDMIACRRVEMLLVDSVDDTCSQLPLEDLERLLATMRSAQLTRRHARLVSLLNKLRHLVCPESRQVSDGDIFSHIFASLLNVLFTVPYPPPF